jgi:hypothetical protein
MSLPPRISRTLHRGEELAAEVRASRPGWRGWVHVRPIMRCGRSFQDVLEEWTRTREAREPYDDTIDLFRVRYVELTDWHIAWDWDIDLAIRERPILELEEVATTEEELEQILSRWLPDLSRLRWPGAARFPL